MADYFSEMGWTPLGEGETPNRLLRFARLLRNYDLYEDLNLSQEQRLPPPASKTAVEALPNEEITAEGSQCPICLKEHEQGSAATKLPCKHLYHNDCIMPWLSKTNSCPLCRYQLPTDDEDYEAWRKEKKRAKEREAELETLHNSMFS